MRGGGDVEAGASAGAEHFLASGELWERIVELFGREGKAPPYREGTRVEYVRQGLDS
jgi:hypothetical protein